MVVKIVSSKTATPQVSFPFRQRYPLSPDLVILCANILAKKVMRDNHVKGITILVNEFRILQYADDTILFSGWQTTVIDEFNEDA